MSLHDHVCNHYVTSSIRTQVVFISGLYVCDRHGASYQLASCFVSYTSQAVSCLIFSVYNYILTIYGNTGNLRITTVLLHL